MTIRISRVILSEILEAAANSPDHEICGLLLGKGSDVHGILPAPNVASNPDRFFEIDPATLLSAHRTARQGGDGIVGHYHSHPAGDARPSREDAAQAHGDGALWIVCTPGGAVTAWHAVGEGMHDQFQPVDMVVE